MNGNDVVIVSALRTAIGNYGGAFKWIRATDLTHPLMKAVIAKAGIDSGLIDDIMWGCCYQRTKDETNMARISSLEAGVPVEVPAFTIHRTCTSAMQGVVSGTQAIKSGDASIVLAGGTESMSNVPYTLDGIRWEVGMNPVELRNTMRDDLTPIDTAVGMGLTAENLAEQFGISRRDQDELAFSSQKRAVAAIEAGRFKDEIMPFKVPLRNGKTKIIEIDEHPRPDTTLEKLAELKPVFKKNGTVTVGNASRITDGSAGIVLMSHAKAKELGVVPLTRIVSYAVAGVHPDIMGYGSIPATRKALANANLTLDDIDLLEVNEAFASQYLAVERELKIDREITNVNGSGIALGHPVGCSGVRIMITLLYEMKKRQSHMGLATLCSAGGMGMTVIIENIS